VQIKRLKGECKQKGSRGSANKKAQGGGSRGGLSSNKKAQGGVQTKKGSRGSANKKGLKGECKQKKGSRGSAGLLV
jgi:hypothetical protein